MTDAPIIFIGMHRSGTSMLGRLLESCGLFAGAQKDANNESIFFQDINSWLLSQCGGRWDMPQAIDTLWDQEEILKWNQDYVQFLMQSPRSAQYLGWKRYLHSGGIPNIKGVWGWKDPRNTFTLPFWLRLFPDAKIIHIKRHGVDVAQSLRVRSQKGFLATTQKYKKYKWLLPLRPKKGGFIESPRCASLEGGFSLWEEYMQQAVDVMQQISDHRLLKLCYEEILEDPVLHLRSCVEFCGMEVSNQSLEAVTVGINASRAYSYQNERILRDFVTEYKPSLEYWGYK